jgi:predicted transposase/invertase (TIGR01784 family)
VLLKEDITILDILESKRYQKAYEHYKDDLHYQASMFESSFGDGYNEGKVEGIVEGINQTTKNIALNLAKEGTTIEIIAKVTGLSEADI